ncbi:FAD-binding protein [Halomarina halobia]|uniref:FAD-binding protein n=1 Tax=Halomarina halobia TaxID=3033386 RepID=A0ABD6AF00_9EURY|nr:FAD-binding protein [Halomarina sp. PSR21]
MVRVTRETDVVVAGTGMAGLVSAVRALEHDADVIVLEKAPRMGGKTIMTAGAMMVDEEMDANMDVYEPLKEGTDWLEEMGVDVKEMTLDVPWSGKEVDVSDFIEHMGDKIESMGGKILLETPFKKLITDEDGEIAGAIAHGDEGPIEITAPNVILATGGFCASEELIQQYITENTEELVLRCDPWSTGDGFMAAKEVGAKATTGLSKFDGHPMIAPPAEYSPAQFEEASQYYGARSIAIDQSGNRFTDESINIFERELIDAMAKEVGGQVFLVIDKDIYNDSWVNGHVGSMVERAKEFGGTVLMAETLEELGEKLSKNGVEGSEAVATINEFNESVEANKGESLEPPRGRYQEPIDTPPFYAVDVRPGLSFTMGGLDINANAEVLCRATSTSRLLQKPDFDEDIFYQPIKGLYATGVDIGNPNRGYYAAGGLSMALASGRVAGKHAAKRAEEK